MNAEMSNAYLAGLLIICVFGFLNELVGYTALGLYHAQTSFTDEPVQSTGTELMFSDDHYQSQNKQDPLSIKFCTMHTNRIV